MTALLMYFLELCYIAALALAVCIRNVYTYASNSRNANELHNLRGLQYCYI